MNWKDYYSLFLLYRAATSTVVCIVIYFFHSNSINSMLIWVFTSLLVFVYSSIAILHFCKIINPLQGSIDRTVKEMMKNDMVKDVKELEMFGSRLNEEKVISFRHSNNESLWLRAFKSGNVKNMKYLLSIDPNIDINERDKQNGRNPLMYASITKNTNAIQLLLNHAEIDVNQCDDDGCNALFHSVKNEHLQITQLLVESGADINMAVDDTGQTPISYCVMNNRVDIINLLLNQPHIDINCTDNNEYNALFYAIKNDNFEIFQLLVESGADVNIIVHESGETPLIMAMNLKNESMIKYLIENNLNEANMNHCDGKGCCALFYAVNDGNDEIVQLLVQSGADVNVLAGGNGQTPIIAATINSRVEMVKLLSQNPDIDINHSDDDGYSALMYAVKNSHFEIVQLLVESGADVNVSDDDTGQTPLMISLLSNRNHDIAAWLLQHGEQYRLDTSVQDKSGKTAWVHCWKTKNFDLMIRYTHYHKKNKVHDWNMQELDCDEINNALTYNFSNILETEKWVSKYQRILFQVLIDGFLDSDQQITWPKSGDTCMLTWIWNQFICSKFKNNTSNKFKIVLQTTALILHNIENNHNINFQVMHEINQFGWTYFFQPFNSVKCFTYFVESIINPKNPVKIDNINQMNKDGETVLMMFAKQKVTDANRKSMQNKCDQLMTWLNYEYSISSERIIHFINIRDKNLKTTAIRYAIYVNNYYFVESILQAFGQHLTLIREKWSNMFKSAWMKIIESQRVDSIRLTVAKMIAINHDDSRLNIINEKTVDECEMGITPLFWALNNAYLDLLRLMLSVKNINLNPMITNRNDNSIWEYVTGLPHENYHVGYIALIDIESIILLINEHKINVNKHDSSGNQALYRICSFKDNYEEESSKRNTKFLDLVFDKQYDAIKLLIENGAKIDMLDREYVKANTDLDAWKKVLLCVKHNKLRLDNKSRVKKYIISKSTNRAHQLK